MFYSGSGLLFCIIKYAVFLKVWDTLVLFFIYCPDEIKIINYALYVFSIISVDFEGFFLFLILGQGLNILLKFL